MPSVSVRYFVDDVDAAVDFYCNALGFSVVMRPAPTFAMLRRGDLRLLLSVPGGGPGGGATTSDGRIPEPGGWNRFAIETERLANLVDDLRARGARFRGQIMHGIGGDQIIVDDPSGNPVELFQPTIDEARLDG